MIVNTPDGPVNFPDTMSKQDIEQALQKLYPPPPVAEQTLPPDRPMPMGEMADPNLVPKLSPMGIQTGNEFESVGLPRKWGEGLNTLRESMQHGLTGGWSEEIGAGLVSAGEAAMNWFKGGDFDVSKRYTPLQQKAESYTQAGRERFPKTSMAGEITGGLAAGATAQGAGATLMGRTVPLLSRVAPRATQTGLAVLEGGGWGALTGAGEAKPGERLAGAGTGAVTGGVTAGVLQGAGNIVANQYANKVASKAIAASKDLKAQGSALYQQADQMGVRYTPPAMQRLGVNLRAAADQPNEYLRPKTLGFLQEAANKFSGKQSVSFKTFAEFRKSLNKTMRGLNPQKEADDIRTLMAMKNETERFARNLRAGDFTGGNAPAAFRLQKAADKIYARAKKTHVIEAILDRAEVKGAGYFTQSGFKNALTKEMQKLYNDIQKGVERGWSPQEIKLIRQMASGGSTSKMVNWLARFAPRGPVSAATSSIAGSLLPLPPMVGTIGLPILGEGMALMADRGARLAGEALRSGAASGLPPTLISRPAQGLGPFIPGLLQGEQDLMRPQP